MRIDRIDIYRVDMPLIAPWRTAFGDDWTIGSVLVRIGSDGTYGWGEAAPGLPTYSPESAQGAFLTVREFLAPLVLGADITSGEQLQRLLSPVKGNRFAKASLDLAWWDLYARSRKEPLYRTLGGSRDTIDVGEDFGVQDSLEQLLDGMAAAVEAGFKRIKLKFRPGWDVDMVRAARERFADTTIHIDCNSGYTLADLGMFRELEQFNLAMIEQPLAHDDLLDHAKLADELTTPICLDESIISVDKARKAVELGSARYVNIKAGRVGGLTNAVAIHDLCRDAGIPCWVGGMLESAVGGSHNLALATLDNFTYPADVFPSARFYTEDLAAPDVVLAAASQITAANVPGCGAEPVPDRLDRMAVEQATLKAP